MQRRMTSALGCGLLLLATGCGSDNGGKSSDSTSATPPSAAVSPILDSPLGEKLKAGLAEEIAPILKSMSDEDLQVVDKRGRNYLFLAVDYGADLATVELLLQRDVALDVADAELQRHLLDAASDANQPGVVRALVLDERIGYETGGNVLHFLATHGDDSLINEYIGIVSSERLQEMLAFANTDGQLPIHRTTYNPDTSAIAALVAAGADLNAGDGDGRTALHLAALRGDRIRYKMLVDLGADPTVADREGRLASDFTFDD